MNSFGKIFRVEIFGESHGESVGVVIDGCPAGIDLKPEDLMPDIIRRQPGGLGTTKRVESDIPHIKSGVFQGRTTGSPIMIEFMNQNQESSDYDEFKMKPRPGQVDFVAMAKYRGFNDHRGGGHFSARLTVGLVAAGAIAKKILEGIDIKARIIEIGGSKNYQAKLEETASKGDTLGGIIECSVYNLPVGLGEPFFYSFESVIGQLLFSIPSIKAVEFGEGFKSAKMQGSEYNDTLMDISGKTMTNNCGGITGGLTNGNQIIFRAALRPPSSISKKQQTLNILNGNEEDLVIKGRHDICPALRSSVIIEAATAIGICDLTMINDMYKHK